MKPHAVVDEVRVRDVMNPNVATVHASHSMPLAASIMELERVRHVPVVDDERRVVGLVTHRDILAAQLRVVAAKPAAPLDGPVSLDLSVPVSTVMRTEVWTIQSSALAASAARLLRDHRFGCLPVVDDGKLVGMVTESDLLALVTEGLELSAPPRPLKVENAMTLFPITIAPDTSIAEARSLMDKYEVRHLPVTNGAHTVGIVSDRDLRVAEAVYSARDGASAQLAVALVGTEMLYEVAPDTLLEVVLAEMARLKIGAAMVVDGGRLVGVLTTMDACRLFSEYLKTLSARALRIAGPDAGAGEA
jgi:CBS domain-containing membrane protein